MPKVNTSLLVRPSPATETRSFDNPLDPDNPFVLTFTAKPDYSEALKIQTMAVSLAKMYTGPGKIPIQVKDENGKGVNVAVPRELCAPIAILLTLQQPAEDGSEYTFEDFVRINAGAGDTMGDIVAWAETLLMKATKPAPSNPAKVEIPNDSAA